MDPRLVTLPTKRSLSPAGSESSLVSPTHETDVVRDRLFGRIPGWALSRPVVLMMWPVYAAMSFGLVRLFLCFVLGEPLPDWLARIALGGVMLGSAAGGIFFTVLTIWQIQDGIGRRRPTKLPVSSESFL